MIAIIAAVAENGVIGSNNELPWGDMLNIPDDTKRFIELTKGNVVVMGRKTYESIRKLGRRLPNRTRVVITRQTDYETIPDFETSNSLEKTIEKYKDRDIFVIGGTEIFKQAIPLADTMYITHIHKEFEGDALFPKVDMKVWKQTEEDAREGFSFAVYKRK
ncbi:MAG: hypothetical protein A3B23_00960 [Candidatus Colwellbacteria bacterium RIFCSPLOWO2_01_FULL_48_10]|uniref:Dihydrofolate reductase n=2 Tax=Bacteria candidate phyla TaxID=1783234 RepID=A0A1F5P2P8_9BACT|nr:MAG: hypothetical protein A2846_04000 [Candidatus Doudnabacteria bacterium RIFCSPHIGHO2_01_FULL_49_9]OGY59513.1 MAG: hypothetical protein A3B23_00960 [Candidatus Colwellbacteria bacterium RIFCSPLOWO2_01_FULL_48_10]